MKTDADYVRLVEVVQGGGVCFGGGVVSFSVCVSSAQGASSVRVCCVSCNPQLSAVLHQKELIYLV